MRATFSCYLILFDGVRIRILWGTTWTKEPSERHVPSCSTFRTLSVRTQNALNYLVSGFSLAALIHKTTQGFAKRFSSFLNLVTFFSKTSRQGPETDRCTVQCVLVKTFCNRMTQFGSGSPWNTR
jgi:hypothetical protein